MSQIAIDYLEYLSTRNDLSDRREALSEQKLPQGKHSSKSSAMDELEQRLRMLKKALKKYNKLLDSDIEHFQAVGDILFEADRKEAEKFLYPFRSTSKGKESSVSGGGSGGGGGVSGGGSGGSSW